MVIACGRGSRTNWDSRTITPIKITNNRMEITYDFAGKKVKKIGIEPQIGTIYEIEDDDIDLTI